MSFIRMTTSRSAGLLNGLLLGSLTAMLGCSLVTAPDRPQCEDDGDCQRFAAGSTCTDGYCAPGETPFDCLDEPPPPLASVPIEFEVQVMRATTQAPLPGVSIRMCRVLDLGCTIPLGSGTSGEDGLVRLTAPPQTVANNQFYLEGTLDGYVPVLHYVSEILFTRPELVDVVRQTRFDMVTPGELVVFSRLGGLEYDDTLGFLFAAVHNCNGERLEAVSFEIDRSDATTGAFYFRDGQVVSSADRTDETGRGGFINVPEGSIRISAEHLGTGQIIFEQGALTRPGWWTSVPMIPVGSRNILRPIGM
jgi:hypothetical protein